MASENVIEVILRAVDQMSQPITGATAVLQALSDQMKAAGGTSAEFSKQLDEQIAQLGTTKGVLDGVGNSLKQYSTTTDEAGKSSKEAGTNISGMGAAVIVLNQGLELTEKVFGTFVDFLKEASQDAGRFEQDVVGLTNTMQVFGKSANPESIVEFSDEMRKTQNVTRELALDVSKTLATFTDLGRGADSSGERLKKLTEITIALAKVTGRSPEFQAIQVANFLQNPSTSSFGRGLEAPQGLTLDEKQLYLIDRYGKLIEVVEKQQDTFIGQQDRMKLALEGVGHVLGGEVNSNLEGLYHVIGDVLQATETWLEKNEKMAATISGIGLAAGGAITVLTALSAIKFATSIEAVEAFGAAFLELASGPIGITIAAIGGLITLVLTLKAILPKPDTATLLTDAQSKLDQYKKLLANASSEDIRNIAKEGIAREQKTIEEQTGKIQSGEFNVVPQDQVFGLFPQSPEQVKNAEVASKQDELFQSLLIKAKEFAVSSQAAMDEAQGQVAANAQKLIYEETGSLDAMFNSFAIHAETARKTTEDKIAALTQKIAKEAGIKPEEVAANPKTAQTLAIESAPIIAEGQAKQLAIQQEKEKFIFDQREKNIQVVAANEKAILDIDQQLLDNDKARLKILQDNGAPLQAQLDLISKTGAEQKDIIERRIDSLQKEQDALQQEGKGYAANSPKLTEIQTKEETITKEILQQKALLEKLPYDQIKLAEEARAAATKNVTQEISAQLNALEALKALDQRRLDLLDLQATLNGKEHASYEDRIALASEIDRIENEVLQAKIAQAKANADLAQNNLNANPASDALKAANDVAQSQLEALQSQAEFVKTKVLEIEASIVKEGDDAAKSLSQSFADQFIQGITNATSGAKGSFLKFLDEIAISTGKAITTQLLQQGLEKLFLPYTTELAKQGEKPPTTIPGLLTSGLFSKIGALFGFGPTPPGAENVFRNFPAAQPTGGFNAAEATFTLPREQSPFEKVLAGSATSFQSSAAKQAESAAALTSSADALKQAASDLSNAAATLSRLQAGAQGASVPAISAVPSSQTTATQLPAISQNLEDIIQGASLKYNVDPDLIKAVIQQESSFIQNPKTGSAGEVGMMQVKPSTAAEVGVTGNLQNPEIGINAGTAYLAKQLQTFSGDVEKAIAAYNAGPNNKAIQQGQIPNKDYVASVMAQMEAFKNAPAPAAAQSQVTAADILDKELGADIADAASKQMDAISNVKAAIVEQGTKTQPTEITSFSPEAASTLEQANTGNPANVVLGPTQQSQGQIIGDLTDAIENLGERKPISDVVSNFPPPGESNVVNNITAAAGGNGFSFSSLTPILGVLQQILGGQSGGVFGKISGGIGAIGALGNAINGIQGLLGGGANTGIFANFPAPTPDLSGTDISNWDFSTLGGGGGIWDSISSGASSIWDSFLGLFHEGGPIDKYKVMHGGGMSDDVPIMGQHGEYVLQRSAVTSIGKSVLDGINTTGRLPKYHDGGMLTAKPVSGMKVPTGVLSALSSGEGALAAPGSPHGSRLANGAGSGNLADRPADPIYQNIFLVDQRPGRLGPNDVVMIVRNDMEKNGPTGKGVQNILKRNRN